jgi:hypothetical protein
MVTLPLTEATIEKSERDKMSMESSERDQMLHRENLPILGIRDHVEQVP